jgi:hypothetical protein
MPEAIFGEILARGPQKLEFKTNPEERVAHFLLSFALAKVLFISYPLPMSKNTLFLIILLVLSGLNLGTVRRTEDPIRDTQTNGILYEQKKEEEKNGKKGPLMYHVKNNPRESFFIDPPFEKAKKVPPEAIATEQTPSSMDATGWWEEQPTATPAVPSAEGISESQPPEPLPEKELAPEPEAAKQPAPAAEAETAPSGKEGDYWW